MYQCDLSIRLEKPDLAYRCGEAIRGEVVVSVDEPCRSKELTIASQWRTHGRGNRTEGQAQTVTLFSGEWSAGEYRYPFELAAPTGPATYHGTVLNVDHYLTARADLPWSVDPKAETEFLLAPAPGAADYFHGPEYKPPEHEKATSLSGLGRATVLQLLFFALSGFLIMVFGVLVALGLGTGPREGGIVMVLVGAVFTQLGWLFHHRAITRAITRWVSVRRLGTPMVKLSRDVVRPGDTIDVTLVLKPRRTLALNAAVVELSGREHAVSGGGTNMTAHDHDVHLRQHSLGAESHLRAGRRVVLQASLEVPAGAPPTFAAYYNDLKWTAKVRLGIAGWPDWEEEFPVTVKP